MVADSYTLHDFTVMTLLLQPIIFLNIPSYSVSGALRVGTYHYVGPFYMIIKPSKLANEIVDV